MGDREQTAQVTSVMQSDGTPSPELQLTERKEWTTPTITDAPESVPNPAGFPVMFLMDGDDPPPS